MLEQESEIVWTVDILFPKGTHRIRRGSVSYSMSVAEKKTRLSLLPEEGNGWICTFLPAETACQ